MRIVKARICEMMPGTAVFLDVDDLESIEELEGYVEASQAMLVLLGSAAYMSSRNCQREVAAAHRLALPLVRVHDADASHKGAPLDDLRRTSERHDERCHCRLFPSLRSSAFFASPALLCYFASTN